MEKQDTRSGEPCSRLADSCESASGGFQLKEEYIDEILRTGGGWRYSRERIYAAYVQGRPPEEMAFFLKTEYGSIGKGFRFDGCPVSAWFDGNGLTAGIGNTAGTDGAVRLTWEGIENRIRCMVESGAYMCASEAALIDGCERERVASLAASFFAGTAGCPVVFMREAVTLPEFHAVIRKMSLEGRAAGDIKNFIDSTLEKSPVFFSMEHCMGLNACIKEMLSDSLETALLERLIKRALAAPHPRRAVQWRREDAAVALGQLRDGLAGIKAAKKAFYAQNFVDVKSEDFITQDELDFRLRTGEGAKHGRFGIYEFFSEKCAACEGSGFLNDEYGMDNAALALMGAAHVCWCCRDGAYTLEKKGEGYEKVPLTWQTAAARARELAREGRFLSDGDAEGYEKYRHNRIAYAVRMECRDVIEQAYYAGYLYHASEKPHGTAGSIIRKYGLGNVEYVLACTVMRRPYEFSEQNVEWAAGIVPELDCDSAELEAGVRPAYTENLLNRVRRHRAHEFEKTQQPAQGEETGQGHVPQSAAKDLSRGSAVTGNPARHMAAGTYGLDVQHVAEDILPCSSGQVRPSVLGKLAEMRIKSDALQEMQNGKAVHRHKEEGLQL